MANEVILYDLPAKDGHAWSFNPFKTRLILNYKGIPYKTEWVEYPDIVAKGKSLGLAENPKDQVVFSYSIPMISIGGKPYMDSAKIAPVLEQAYPDPPLHLDEPIVATVGHLVPKQLMPKLVPAFMPLLPDNVLNPPSAEYTHKDRSQRFGMPLAELLKTKGGETAWQAADADLREIARLLNEDNSGPFFLGNKVSYADFYIISLLHCLKRIDVKLFDRFLTVDPAFGKLYDAGKQWLAKDQ